MREDAARGVQRLRDAGLDVVLVSDDRADRTRDVAQRVGVTVLAADTPAPDPATTLVVGAGLPGLPADGLGLADHDVSRVARAVDAARTAVRDARGARAVALAAGAVGVVLAAAHVLVPWSATVWALAVAAVTVGLAGRD